MNNVEILETALRKYSINPANIRLYIDIGDYVEDVASVIAAIRLLISSRGRSVSAMSLLAETVSDFVDFYNVASPLWIVGEGVLLSKLDYLSLIVFDKPQSYDDLFIRLGYGQTDGVSLHYLTNKENVKMSIDQLRSNHAVRFSDQNLVTGLSYVPEVLRKLGTSERVNTLTLNLLTDIAKQGVKMGLLLSPWFYQECGRGHFFDLSLLEDEFGKLPNGVFDLSEDRKTFELQLSQSDGVGKVYRRYIGDNYFNIHMIALAARYFIEYHRENGYKFKDRSAELKAFYRFCAVGSFGLANVVINLDSRLIKLLSEYLHHYSRAVRANLGGLCAGYEPLGSIVWPIHGQNLLTSFK